MNKLNLNKVLAAGIFAAIFVAVSASGAAVGGASAPVSTKISTVAGGGSSATTTNPTQANLGIFLNIVARDKSLIFNSAREGKAYKLQTLNLATNQLATASYSGIAAGDAMLTLLSVSADNYYFLSSTGLLYEANSAFVAKHIAGKSDSLDSGFIDNEKGKLASFNLNPLADAAVLYQNQLFFVDENNVRKVTLSGDYPISTVIPGSDHAAGSLTLKGDKLIITDLLNALIFEYDLKTGGIKNVAGINDPAGGYVNAENPLQAKLSLPTNITTSPSGNIYFTVWGVADIYQRIIRKLAVNNGVYGAVTTAFGAAPGSKADKTELNNILDLEFVDNNLYVLDHSNDGKFRIKKIEFGQTP